MGKRAERKFPLYIKVVGTPYHDVPAICQLLTVNNTFGYICSFSLLAPKENEPKEMRFAAARFLPKIGRFSLKRENLQHCISFRVASDSSRFFTLETTQFLNGKNRKAACDFGNAPYFREY